MEHPEDKLYTGAVLMHYHAGLLHITVIIECLVEPEVQQEVIGTLHLDPEHGHLRGVGHYVDGQDVHLCRQSPALMCFSYKDATLFISRFTFTEEC